MDLWDAIGLDEAGILAAVGAGGKTSLLLTLAKEAKLRHKPVLISTTTKLYFSQIASFGPVICNDYIEGAAQVAASLHKTGMAAWFGGREGEKVTGLAPQWLDKLSSEADKNLWLLVEADGARESFLKAPAAYEPIVPNSAAITVGVLNLQAVGQFFTKKIVHRLELVLEIVHKEEQECINWQDLAVLATDPRGIFRASHGRKLLLLAGAEYASLEVIRQIADSLVSSRQLIQKCIAVKGYGESLEPVAVYSIW